MTTTAKKQQMTITGRLIEAFGATWTAIQKRHGEVPNVVITIGSGTEVKGKARFGHFQPNAWQQVDAGTVHELFVSGEGLARDALAILGTLLHEAAHGVAHTREIQDTSRQGRYHNRKFRDLAIELGLDVAEDAKFGWSTTTVPEATAKVYGRQLQLIEAALIAYRHAEIHLDKPKKSSNLAVATCGCEDPRKIRVAKSTLDIAPITCGACGTDFEAEEQ